MSRPEFVYWDLGNVVVTDNLGKRLFSTFGQEYTGQQKEAWQRHRIGTTDQDTFLNESIRGTPLESRLEEVRKKSYALIEVHPESALPLIRALDGRVEQGILSNHTIDYVLAIQDLTRVHEYVGDNQFIVSAEVGFAKPDARMFKLAIDRAGVDPETIIFFDDKDENVMAAQRAGMQAFQYHQRKDAESILQRYNLL